MIPTPMDLKNITLNKIDMLLLTLNLHSPRTGTHSEEDSIDIYSKLSLEQLMLIGGVVPGLVVISAVIAVLQRRRHPKPK